MPLTPEQIADLLKPKQKAKVATVSSPVYPPPMQIGSVRYTEKDRPCTGGSTITACRSPTRIRVDDKPLCTQHALMKLNRMLLELTYPNFLDDCNCMSGTYSNGQCHSAECPVAIRFQEYTIENPMPNDNMPPSLDYPLPIEEGAR